MIKELWQNVTSPWAEIAILRAENADLRRQLSERDAIIAKLTERIAELERRLGLNSSNSSKPPSSDGLRKKPAPRSLRTKGKKKSGGQPGHDGQTLKQVDNPDETLVHTVLCCSECGADLRAAVIDKIQKRQVFDIPLAKIIITEHQIEFKTCFQCGNQESSSFSDNVKAPVQYGDRIKAAAIYLQHQHFIPEDRLSELLGDLFAVPISTATLAKMGERFSEQLAPFEDQVLDFLKYAPVKNLDETSYRIGGKTKWLHVLCNEHATHYRAGINRGDVPVGLRGTVVHDHFKSYYRLHNVEHGLCNAHHLRELKALSEIEKEPWAKKMAQLLRIVGKVSKRSCVQAEFNVKLDHWYDQIIAHGLAYHESLDPLHKGERGPQKRRIGHNILIRLRDYKCDILRCLSDQLVPFTNNQAEQDIRMMKVKQKISGGFRTEQGAKGFCRIRSFLSTTRKQGGSLLESIKLAMNASFNFEFG
jgi:transposase